VRKNWETREESSGRLESKAGRTLLDQAVVLERGKKLDPNMKLARMGCGLEVFQLEPPNLDRAYQLQKGI